MMDAKLTLNSDIDQMEIGEGCTVSISSDVSPALLKRWETLLSTMLDKRFLHLPQWYKAYLISYYRKCGDDIESLFIELCRHDKTLAILPFIKRTVKIGPINSHVLELMWPTDLGVRDCIVFDQSIIDSLLDSVTRSLQHAGIQWDLIAMPDIIEGSAAFQLVSQQKTLSYKIQQHHFTARIPADGDMESCLSFLSSRMRKRLNKYYDGLSRKGAVQIRIAKQDELSESLYDMFLDIEASGWKGAEETRTALRYNECQQQFYRSLFSSDTDACVVASLWLNDSPIAAKICLEVGDTLSMLKIGYDADFTKDYPGMVLLRHLIQHYSTHPRIRYIAFVTNPEWSQRWRPELLSVYEAFIYNSTMTGKTIQQIDSAKDRARKIKSTLKTFGEK